MEKFERFDNITDEEIEEGIREIEKKRKNPWRKYIWGTIAFLMILILIIGYEIAPNFSFNRHEYFLSWIR